MPARSHRTWPTGPRNRTTGHRPAVRCWNGNWRRRSTGPDRTPVCPGNKARLRSGNSTRPAYSNTIVAPHPGLSQHMFRATLVCRTIQQVRAGVRRTPLLPRGFDHPSRARPPAARFDEACGCPGHDGTDRFLKEAGTRRRSRKSEVSGKSPRNGLAGPALIRVSRRRRDCRLPELSACEATPRRSLATDTSARDALQLPSTLCGILLPSNAVADPGAMTQINW